MSPQRRPWAHGQPPNIHSAARPKHHWPCAELDTTPSTHAPNLSSAPIHMAVCVHGPVPRICLPTMHFNLVNSNSSLYPILLLLAQEEAGPWHRLRRSLRLSLSQRPRRTVQAVPARSFLFSGHPSAVPVQFHWR